MHIRHVALACLLAVPLLPAAPASSADLTANAAPLALDVLIEFVSASADGRILGIEPSAPGASARYVVTIEREGHVFYEEVELSAGRGTLGGSDKPGNGRLLEQELVRAFAGDPPSLAESVRRARAIAKGFVARAAEYEMADGRLLAEIELERKGTVIELALDAHSGEVIAVELEGDEADADDAEQPDADAKPDAAKGDD